MTFESILDLAFLQKHIWIHLNSSLEIDLGGEIIVLVHIRKTLS